MNFVCVTELYVKDFVFLFCVKYLRDWHFPYEVVLKLIWRLLSNFTTAMYVFINKSMEQSPLKLQAFRRIR
jgi:hypothetical protein